MRAQVLVVGAALLVAGCSSAAGGSTGSVSSGPTGTPVTVTLTDAGCTASTTTVPAGLVTFAVTSTGSGTVSEVEVQRGSRILAEKEDVAPGLSARFSVRLDTGSYTLACPGGSGPGTQTFTATAPTTPLRTTPMTRTTLPLLVLASALVLAGCSSGTDAAADMAVDVHLTGAGCTPGQLALPAAPVTLHVTNDAGSGELDIQDSTGASVAKIAQIDQGATADLPVHLATGYYTVECRTDDTPTTLTVGTPSTPPVDLGSVAAPDTAAPAGYGPADGNRYASTNLVASSAAYDPQVVDPSLVDAWGLADRPAGKGGHIWVGANKTGSSLEYVGDVGGAPLSQADLRTVSVPGAPDTDPGAPATSSVLGTPTGIVFNPTTGFVVDQGAISGPAKFLFAGQDGTISAWTEQANANGSTTQLAWATRVVDDSAAGSQFFGLAISPDGSRLLAADFGPKPGIVSVDTSFHAVATTGFANPFTHGPVEPGDLEPWNVTTVGSHVYVSYAAVGADETDATKPSTGEEQHAAGAGRVVEYTGDGTLVKVLADKGSLDAPWGITTAPKGFGKLAGDLLVASFGDGTISAFDASGTFVDHVRSADGKVLVDAGIWALMPGNGASLGAADAVYFTAGPRGEQDGVFGRITAAS